MGPLKGNSSQIIAAEAIDWLKGVKKEKPFLLSVWFHAPHEPVAVSDEWAKKYAAEPDAERRQYLGCVALMDHAVGRILKALDERGCLENTFIVFTSDNGPETLKRYPRATRSHGSPGPLRGMKLHLTEGGIRVPGILAWKGRIKPGVSGVPVCNVDVLPTACELAGVAPPKAPLDGTSLVPLIDGKPLKRAVPLYWQYDRALGGYHFALRDGPWKLLAGPKMEKPALYNLEDDLGEKKDLAAEQPARVKAMLGAMRKRHKEIDPLTR
jgi:arylsulfatase A